LASPGNILEAPIPRSLLWIGTPVAAFVLIMIFSFLRFPYDDLARPLAQQIGAATGSDVSIGHVSPRITIGGPGVALHDIQLLRPDRSRVSIDVLRLRPAWSISWLYGDAALRLEVESAIGSADGIVVLGDPLTWKGEFVDVDVANLPWLLPRGLLLAGRVTAAADLVFLPDGPSGPLSFDATAGTIQHPLIPMPLDFERINGDLLLGGDAVVNVRSFELDGPVVFANVTGPVRRGARPGENQLELAFDVELKSPPLRSLVQSMGVPIDARGRTTFDLGGTPSAPRPSYR
jgi:type II secretion system protein N